MRKRRRLSLPTSTTTLKIYISIPETLRLLR